MAKLFRYSSMAVFIIATISLTLLALTFIALALYQVGKAMVGGQAITGPMLEGISLIIIALAVFDVAKFLMEEEIFRERELRSAGEARRTLTKFLTIIIIATSLESLVFIFQAGKERVESLLYPSLLLGVVVLLIGALGFYQHMSRSAELADKIPDQTPP